ncbi:restriction endonuclease subunit S [Aeromonas hydrophila]|nr:restriction endonuclease subunit S [Aeromonas hydrophila]
MSDMHEISLRSFFSHSITGEWGSEPIGNKDVTVFRAADFTKDCKLRRDGGVLRAIPPSKLNARRLENNDILIEKSGGSPDQPVGRAVMFEPQDEEQVAVCSNFIQRMVVKECYEPLFVYYLLLFLYEQNATLPYQQQTTGIINLKLDEYLELQVKTYLERSVQTQIASILKSVDQQIALTLSQIEKMTLLKKGMMADLFSRGIDPTTGHLRPSFHDAPEFYYHTPLGPAPKGWEYGLLKRFVRAAEYGISTSLNEDVTGIPVLRMNNIQNNRFDVTDLKYTKDPDAYRLRLKKGDVLYNRTNSMEHVGKTAVWREELDECSFASYLVRLNLHEDLLKPEYFAHWMSQESSQNALRAFATPAVQQVNINPTNLQRVEICCPSDPHEQDLIVERIDALDDNIAAESANLIKLQDQKAGLMRDLLTGMVPVGAQ